MTRILEEVTKDSERLEKKSAQLRKEFEIFLEEVSKKFDELEKKSQKTEIFVKRKKEVKR